ncbi:ribosome inactivating protein precursor [Panicum miliaceum]|uniref:Ribosome inactivating protein n=1 Tax=Panicum miliaceum TaxID=4540 RepID=A0A3L6SSR8_PANMI|nr:ribosome inactivating protein precursor [Panicum miliaceum]
MELLRFLLLLVSLAFAPLAQAKLYRVKFDLATETHADLYAKLNTTLRSTNSPHYIPPDVQGKVVLGPRREEFTSRPRAWLMVDVKFEQAKTTLAIAIDDLCLLGFMNSAGDCGRWKQVSFIPPDQTEYVVFWGKLSRLLLKWAQNGYSSWYGYDGVNQEMAKLAAQRIRVNDRPDALRLVDFLLRPTPCAPGGPLNC